MRFVALLKYLLISLMLVATITIPSNLKHSANASPDSGFKIFPPDSKPYGKTYGEWTAKWWQWVLAIPMNENPNGDETGERCGINQNDSSVWFLAGTPGGNYTRTCSVPAGKSILLPIINVRCDHFTDPTLSKDELAACAKEDQDKVNFLDLTIDGKKIDDIKSYRFQSPLSNFTLPPDNYPGLPEGTTYGVSDGWWIMSEPLSKGNHTMRAHGNLVDVTNTGTTNFQSDLKLNLIVK